MIGKTISHYKILKKLGEGGMGVVYKAEDTKLKRTVALKFLPPELVQSEEWKERFLREAQAAAALTHPNICTIHEIDELTEGQGFIAMEYVDGKSLADKIESGPLDIDAAINIALRIAEGLKHAHRRGIVHRDIKPANIMVTADGQVKIMDFGLAKLTGKTRLTKTATVMGTVAYMSPEQARGDKDLSHQTDIWSLGVVLYEMLTGRLPFEAETDTGLIYKIINEYPEPVTNRRSDTPGSLASVVEKMLQKDTHCRYENTEELIVDLESVKARASILGGSRSPSIAVLPFVNMSADPEQEYFCDGLSEEIINALTKIRDLKVIARTSAFAFKDEKVEIGEIGRRLKVQTVLEGSVRKVGNRLRITAQLVDTSGGHHLWSERYDRELVDIFAIQDEITLAIVDNLKPMLLGEEKAKLEQRQTVDLEAYNLYLKGRWFLWKRTEEGFEKAFEYFNQAIAKAPTYAPAYAGVADSYALRTVVTMLPAGEDSTKARDAAMKALEFDDTLAEAHVSLGLVKTNYEWDWEGAEREYKRAIELNPGYAMGHAFYAAHLYRMTRFDEALEEVKYARHLDPLSLTTNFFAGMIFFYAGRYDNALAALSSTIEMDRSVIFAHAYRGLCYWRKAMLEEAMAEFEKEKSISGEFSPMADGCIGIHHALIGNMEEARKKLRELQKRSTTAYFQSYPLAMLCLAIGDTEQGFELLEKAYEERDSALTFIKVQAAFDVFNIRSDPRYIALLKKMKLEP
ncbi:MAG: hypothetical protein C4532_09100 [Candidatus Abyssobacteria bacterium SURF_17]|uniref:non-specific serine/threonine protein kinase n=1 Tax=Candidatus Abyssobacteria bacterium SURF_17 TaxID=2093361 RepID=A0A419EZ95_9BACT|nr:MAG: hypothetical protein C4532_09100 [Candidatus Abyssubacteria bacterium SURF_17]